MKVENTKMKETKKKEPQWAKTVKNFIKGTKQRKKQKLSARAAALVMAFSLILSFAGCGKIDEPSQSSSLPGQEVSGGKEGTGETGMGRYVEKPMFELEEGGRYTKSYLQILSDGQIAVCNHQLGVYLSGDGGGTWKQDENSLLTKFIKEQKNYIIASGVSKEGGGSAVLFSLF